MREIKVYIGQEYQVKVLEQPDPNDLFYPAYQQAAKEVAEIVRDTMAYNRLVDGEQKRTAAIDYSNNIIAFNGDRGQGKSSAMLSFSKFLNNSSCGSKEIDDLFKESIDTISQSSFIILDRIDPTKFEKSENILTVILAKLFHRFVEYWKQSPDKNQSKRDEILQQFEICYASIKALKGTDCSDDSIIGTNLERLRQIGDSENLKSDFMKLIHLFGEFYCLNKKIGADPHLNFLVIQLDDTDLDVERAKEIMEDIRKYFMLPNVIILMAVDVKQLIYAIEQGHINLFDKLQKDYQAGRPIEYHKIAVKYIDKLMPGKRNIALPKLHAATHEFPEKITLKYVQKDSQKNILDFRYNQTRGQVDSSEEPEFIEDVQELVLRYIYQKTGIIFVKPETHLHYIIPRTIRSLVNLLSILNGMEDTVSNNNPTKDLTVKNLETRLKNIETLENYFVNTWIQKHVDVHYISIIQNFIETPWTLKNKQLLIDLRRTFSVDSEGVKVADSQVDRTQKNAEAPNETVSFGMVLDLLSQIESIIPEQTIFKLAFTIRTLYSINCSKMVCNDLIQEAEKKNDYDRYTVIDFYGGDAFGNTAKLFIRQTSQKDERAVYDLELNPKKTRKKDSIESTLENVEFLKRLNSDSLFYLALFLNFDFPHSDSDQSKTYRNPIQSKGNNAVSTHLKFNVTYPFFYIYQPYLAAEKVFPKKDDFDSYIKEHIEKQEIVGQLDRFTAMNILTSADLISSIRTKAAATSLVRSHSDWRYVDYLADFFLRVETIIREINYLPLSASFSFLFDLIYGNENLFDAILKQQIKNNNSKKPKAKTKGPIKQLQTPQTYEDIRARMVVIDDVLSTMEKSKKASINMQLQKYLEAKEKIKDKSGAFEDEKTRKEFQSPCNSLIIQINKITKE